MAVPRFGRVQLRIMRVLWARERANAREITDTLNAEAPIAHSTVQTLLRKLEAKGAVGHDRKDRTFVFYPRVRPDKVKHGATQELIERMFEGSPAGLVSYLLKHEGIGKAELDRIRDLVNGEEE